MVLASDIGSMFESNPACWGGRPYVRGKRVTVHRIAIAHSQGLSPPEIATDYGLELAEVHAALAHYFAHQQLIDADSDAYDAESERIARTAEGDTAGQ